MNQNIVLASASPRRQALLRQIGLTDFRVIVTETDESWEPSLTPEQVVSTICRRKAEAALAMAEEGDIVITADTMVFLDDERLGKPHSEEEAFTMLSHLSGREHTVWTGVTVARGDRMETEAEATRVQFRPLAESEIRNYIATGEPMDKAGAYGIQEMGALLVEGIHGDYFNVMGLPVLRLSRMLCRFGVELL